MSSLLQFSGKISSRGVHLQALKMPEGYPNNARGYMEESEHRYYCPDCHRWHDRIFTFARKPRGMFGCWIVFRWNGEDHVPDLSVPISLDKLPRDARPLSLLESSAIWHS